MSKSITLTIRKVALQGTLETIFCCSTTMQPLESPTPVLSQSHNRFCQNKRLFTSLNMRIANNTRLRTPLAKTGPCLHGGATNTEHWATFQSKPSTEHARKITKKGGSIQTTKLTNCDTSALLTCLMLLNSLVKLSAAIVRCIKTAGNCRTMVTSYSAVKKNICPTIRA